MAIIEICATARSCKERSCPRDRNIAICVGACPVSTTHERSPSVPRCTNSTGLQWGCLAVSDSHEERNPRGSIVRIAGGGRTLRSGISRIRLACHPSGWALIFLPVSDPEFLPAGDKLKNYFFAAIQSSLPMVLSGRKHQPASLDDFISTRFAQYFVTAIRFQLQRWRVARRSLSGNFHRCTPVGPGKIRFGLSGNCCEEKTCYASEQYSRKNLTRPEIVAHDRLSEALGMRSGNPILARARTAPERNA